MNRPLSEYAILGASLIVCAALFIWGASQLPIEGTGLAFDWHVYHDAFRGGSLTYNYLTFNPPWSLVFMMPLGLLPFTWGWGLMIYFSFMMYVISPFSLFSHPDRKTLAFTLFMALTYPALKIYAESNLDGFALGAMLLIIYGYRHESPIPLAIGVLVATVKPQTTWLFMLILALYCLQAKPIKFWGRALFIVAIVVILTSLWRGEVWLDLILDNLATTQNGISLVAIKNHHQLHPAFLLVSRAIVLGITLMLVIPGKRELSFAKVSLLVTASMVVATFSNFLSLNVALPFCALSLYQRDWRLGLAFLAIYSLPLYYSLITGDKIIHNNIFWAYILCLHWGISAWAVFKEEFQGDLVKPTVDKTLSNA